MHRDPETRLGGSARSFPVTRHSAIAAAKSDDPQERTAGHDALIRAYWKPCYAYARLRWRLSNEDAKELAQEFFTRAFAEHLFARYEPARGRFQSFLRGCLELHAKKQREREGRLVRGEGARAVEVENAGELSDAASEEQRESVFEREWRRHVLELGVEALRAQCAAQGKASAFALLERYDLHDPTRGPRPGYADLAREFALPETTVTNQLHWARGMLRELVLQELERAAGSEDEWRADARSLFGESAP
jgi:DNA-directed RNA polymerase specialized sigma24 family protein